MLIRHDQIVYVCPFPMPALAHSCFAATHVARLVRRLSRARCVGRTAREILQAEKLEKVLTPNKRQKYGQSRPPHQVTESLSMMHLFPRELLDWSFEALEQESQMAGKQGDRARSALKLILSPQFDKPR